ncbi:excinuclease ABC subunit C, partial [Bradyrhizobium guangdongense]|uniref:GIY-YIG nuclease family protein n=1 Tax=Bradyrhizobium guangdongense TaxID=1325090 RepID=UPI001642913B
MAHDSTDNPAPLPAEKSARGTALDAPPEGLTPPDVDPAAASSEDDDEGRLPDILEETGAIGDGPLATGHEAIERAVRLAPTSAGVYRMLNANNDVLYVGKAKNVKKRLSNYARRLRCALARVIGE